MSNKACDWSEPDIMSNIACDWSEPDIMSNIACDWSPWWFYIADVEYTLFKSLGFLCVNIKM